MRDLECQLGDTTTEYLSIQVTFCHSGFPQVDRLLSSAGVTRIHTRVETRAVAVIKRHNTSSLWSPRPVPQTNPLFAIIASNWGADAANDVMHRIHTSRSTPRKAANADRLPESGHVSPLGTDESIKPTVPWPGPPVPVRKTSLQRCPMALGREKRSATPEVVITDTDDDADSDPARKIWSEMRRLSTRGKPTRHVRPRGGGLPSLTAFPSLTTMGTRRKSGKHVGLVSATHATREAETTQRVGIREQTPVNKETVETSRERVPTATGMPLDGMAADGQSGGKGQSRGYSLMSRANNGSTSSRKEKETSRWGWGVWWQ
ncbi:hypothetical protein QBC33DRAFT_91945 [Phialemonium atrogriseum]|uniref:Uncharacterized protein n=1 Tax=Phialemonium atrogriseum TaxID=1093897 RepID=A0AAJ0FGR7_9PEZI|nr:uncharacterized protein QBC33DRAFT_91945 [Phialemonium atrogriseum]KAK1766872.1 hypothetical protein QBC33DRAFT_91945 [Phialemonium atrogriseum]